MNATTQSNEIAISVEGLKKRYGEVVALDGIDFQVPKGSVLGLLGPNGAGKTTTVRILTTILQATEGRATILGTDVAKDPQTVREKIGLAGQYAAVDENLTGRENLHLIGRLTHQPRSTIKGRADELLERFNLTDAAHRPAKTYSGGMRRRLDLAAALVHRPPVLFLDEPTTGLDPVSRSDLWGVISELVEDGTTLLITTHYLEEADKLANNIIVIDGGKIIAQGTAQQLKSQLGASIVEITFSDPTQATQASGALQILGSTSVNSSKVLEIKVNDGSRAVIEAVRILDREKLAPVSLSVREPTLDDVFLSLTGHKAEKANENGAAAAKGRARRGKP